MAFNQPFDLYHWFVNVFAGNIYIFLALAFVVIGAIAAMFRMPTIVTGFFFALFVIMLSVITGNVYALVLFVIAIIVGFIFMRWLK